ncbi:magnesium/cobalt transporter CorA [Aureispira sp. CCB-E]|uniref:magnesium/cobalt transporter CorA n=1 Tax=Aureispira sp. CCB-E TaxID=3051121 RepID=UPI0028696146|nr:magnesium/cobalt transporter CorA [Aureispira sp. CCB-E]WMX12853.1 magnesium/cobalt transporter CorA [Aureispira sp. CCB-E]
MARFIKKKKEEIGLAPDDLLFRGKPKVSEVRLRVIDFDAVNLIENVVNEVKDVLSFQEKDTVTWFNIDGLHNTSIMEELAAGFHLEHLILADVLNTQARPKVEEHDNCIFLSIKMLQHDADSDMITVENLSLIITPSVLISFQEKDGDVFEPVRDRIRKQKKRIRNGGTDYLAFALLDIVIDNYIYIIGVLGQKIESLEEYLLNDPSQAVVEKINAYKRELNFLRKNIKPAKEMILAFNKLDSDLIGEGDIVIHLKELEDNINHATELTDSYREILSDQLNIYHTTISSKLNDIMKFLTVFSVIFIPLTFIAGIYGTNFDYIPELKYRYSYFIMWVVMIVVAVGMLIYFKLKKWF